MQVKNKTDELEYDIYKNNVKTKMKNEKSLDNIKNENENEIHYANKGTDKILKKLKEKDHQFAKPFLERQKEHSEALKTKKIDNANIVYKNTNFTPKINDYKLENQNSPQKLVKIQNENQKNEIRMSIDKQKNNIDNLKKRNNQKNSFVGTKNNDHRKHSIETNK